MSDWSMRTSAPIDSTQEILTELDQTRLQSELGRCLILGQIEWFLVRNIEMVFQVHLQTLIRHKILYIVK